RRPRGWRAPQPSAQPDGLHRSPRSRKSLQQSIAKGVIGHEAPRLVVVRAAGFVTRYPRSVAYLISRRPRGTLRTGDASFGAGCETAASADDSMINGTGAT